MTDDEKARDDLKKFCITVSGLAAYKSRPKTPDTAPSRYAVEKGKKNPPEGGSFTAEMKKTARAVFLEGK